MSLLSQPERLSLGKQLLTEGQERHFLKQVFYRGRQVSLGTTMDQLRRVAKHIPTEEQAGGK